MSKRWTPIGSTFSVALSPIFQRSSAVANYIVSYDLRGPGPTPHEVDEQMGNAGWVRGRILNTVWYVSTDESTREVFDHVKTILAAADRLMVVNAAEAFWHNLLVQDASLQGAFHSSA